MTNFASQELFVFACLPLGQFAGSPHLPHPLTATQQAADFVQRQQTFQLQQTSQSSEQPAFKFCQFLKPYWLFECIANLHTFSCSYLNNKLRSRLCLFEPNF